MWRWRRFWRRLVNRPVTIDDVPASLRRRFLGRPGTPGSDPAGPPPPPPAAPTPGGAPSPSPPKGPGSRSFTRDADGNRASLSSD